MDSTMLREMWHAIVIARCAAEDFTYAQAAEVWELFYVSEQPIAGAAWTLEAVIEKVRNA